MGKLTIQEIAKILVEKNKLTTKEANQFAGMMFEVIQQHLNEEGLVKIKGLGTFKMIRVEARESVSVRTGERVMIDSHAKITFTPDATMKELVNKPFSQFDTVILNDGVEFADIPEEDPEEEQVQEQVQDQVQEQVQEKVQDQETPVISGLMEQQVVDGQPITEQPVEEQPVEEEPVEEESPVVVEDEEESGSWKKTLGYILLTLALMAVSAYAGYWYGQQTVIVEEPVVETPAVIVPDSVEVITADSAEVNEESVAEDPKPEVKQETVPEKKKEQEPEGEPFWKKYEAMDARVRTGAYHIVGTDHEVTVRKGETLSKIARHELGEGMSCYIEVYNGLKANSELKEGQTIKIPKLKWKKKR